MSLYIENLHKSFTGQYSPVLNGINLKINEGEFCILLGGNGSGKSTLLRCISGEYPANAGIIKLENEDITPLPFNFRSKFIGNVTQDINNGTIGELTLLENFVLSKLRGKNSRLKYYKNHTQEVINLIKLLDIGLEKYLHMPLNILSGGQRQMLATLMAISSQPKILLLDEHTSALDPKMQHFIMKYTAERIKIQNITTIMITHNLKDALLYGNRIILLHKGKIAYDIKDAEKEQLTLDSLFQLFQNLDHASLD